MKFIRAKKHISISLLLFGLSIYGCQSDCSINCPAECIPITFVLTRDGENILENPTSFKLDDMRVESLPDNPEAPPLLGLSNNSFKLVVCQNIEYTLYLNDSLVIDISARLDTISTDECCVYFAANSIELNGHEICTNQDQCGGGIYELH